MDCISSVAGPVQPNMTDSCCSQFQSGVCDSPAIQSLPPMEEEECQKRCRADKECLFYSSTSKSCLLHALCPERKPCQGCRSGPKRPPVGKLTGNCELTTVTAATTSTPNQLQINFKSAPHHLSTSLKNITLAFSTSLQHITLAYLFSTLF